MTRTIRLERRMTQDAATRLWQDLQTESGADIELDASDVRHLGATALQVLIVANRRSHRDGQTFKLISPSEAFAEGLRLMGSDDLLNGGIV